VRRRSFFTSLLAGLLPLDAGGFAAQTTTPPPVPPYVREFEGTMGGVPDGKRVLFTLTYTPVSNLKLDLFLNGFLQREGPTYDYTCSGRSVWFTHPPQPGDFVTAQYPTQ
jgi:hypothetical protein